MWIDDLSTAHLEQKNDLEIFAFPVLEKELLESRENVEVPSRYEGNLNNRRTARPLLRLVVGDERWETPGLPPGCSPSKLGWNRAKSYCHMYGAQD
ncbi:hypothetical protein TNCV_3271821 [Trichonephila clavipes]|nr:hypothetical protein TNCV_3271821 [Trichonephila clavipes]